jgi:hypothetical protein
MLRVAVQMEAWCSVFMRQRVLTGALGVACRALPVNEPQLGLCDDIYAFGPWDNCCYLR